MRSRVRAKARASAASFGSRSGEGGASPGVGVRAAIPVNVAAWRANVLRVMMLIALLLLVMGEVAGNRGGRRGEGLRSPHSFHDCRSWGWPRSGGGLGDGRYRRSRHSIGD